MVSFYLEVVLDGLVGNLALAHLLALEEAPHLRMRVGALKKDL